jgi:hypothetical protein
VPEGKKYRVRCHVASSILVRLSPTNT